MNDSNPLGSASGPYDDSMPLAHWLLDVLAPAAAHTAAPASELAKEAQLELTLDSHYHLKFYQQIPDFAEALLQQDSQAAVRYAPLLVHLVTCATCHHEYLEIYDALRAALYPQGSRALLGQGTRTLSATPHRMLSHLCQTLISQAEAMLYQGRHAHQDQDEAARASLQMALRISAHITQGGLRRQALQELVRVATLFDGPAAPQTEDPASHAYTPVMAGNGGARRGKVMRRADTFPKLYDAEQPVIELQSQSLEGYITQQGQMLELHLQGLEPALRGRHVTIAVRLGALLEPVRWLGGNPLAIRSTVPVANDGSLVMPLGESELFLTDPEERNLLEALFLLLEVRASA